ncbi:MAG TPA: formate dehydrogenase accessory sulfurtransferase FdhD [Thermoanaerobaculia bacterium]|nr:formate dehydrogenase accessory sulfurtransferase FdhD [Thermoanaerobaculia bacterium]
MEPVERVRIRAREGETEIERADALAVEEPLEIRLRGEDRAPAVRFVTTMRTPGHDEELAAGLLFAEGVLAERSDLAAFDRPSDPRVAADLRANVVIATLSPEALARAGKLTRGTVMGSACGVCGKTSIENVMPEDGRPIKAELRIAPDVLYALPERLRQRQSVFAQTGGLHAAALFTAGGELVALREDIGRHNATDKLVGSFWLADKLPLSEAVLLVSGRAGFEIAQKAYTAGIPVLASVSAPSSLAVELAEKAGLTLVGFLRGRRYNVYAHPRRVGGSIPLDKPAASF